MRVLFWGTPDFALPSLRALLGEGHDVLAVVTQPDRPAGRGRELQASPVKRLAQAEHIPVLQPERARDAGFVEQIRRLEPDISVVVAYGQLLTPEVLELPRHGSINAHASLLPKLRGAAPINWAIVRGESETGVTVMRMVEAMDAGPILLQIAEPIGPDETATDLWTRLSEISAAALVETLARLEFGGLEAEEQDDALATYAPRITREDARIEWALDAESVDRLIRGMDAVPGAWTTWAGSNLKVFRPRPVPGHGHGAEPGTILDADAHDPARGLLVACGSGAVHLREVQPAGRRRMTSAEWVRGRGPKAGERFE